MNKLYFGTAGIPLSTPDRNTLNGIPYLRQLGLDAMELEFVRSVNITEEKTQLVKAMANKHDITLSCHGQYFVNLNAKDPATLKASIERVLLASNRAWQCGAYSICFHMAYYMGDAEEIAYKHIKKNVRTIVKELQNSGNKIWLRPETGGKITQFSDVEWLVKLSQEVEQVQPCIDWAHHCARTNGRVNDYDNFKNILILIEERLGKDALNNMQMHIEGIEWNGKGERSHLNFADSAFNYKDALKAMKEFDVKGTLISESPNIEQDAIVARDYYEGL